MYQRNSQGWLKHLDFIVLDILVLQAAFFLAYDLRHGFFKIPYEVLLYRTMAAVLVFLDLMAAVLFSTMRDVMKRGPLKELEQTIKQAAIVLAGEIIYLFAVQDGGAYSRIVSFLTAALHFRISSLHRCKIQIFCRSTRVHGGGCSAAKADVHGRSAQNYELGSRGNMIFYNVFSADIAPAACQHNRFVVAAHLSAVKAVNFLFIGSEVSAQIRTAKLVIEAGSSQRSVYHNLQGRSQSVRLAEIILPRLKSAWDLKIGYAETADAGLWS